MAQTIRDNHGFTLLEILIALALSGLVLSGIYRVFQQQIRTNNTQTQVVDMQQNIRVAVHFMESEIRMAGLDPSTLANAGILAAGSNTITISLDTTGGQLDGIDNDNDGLIDEGTDTLDNDGDGLIDEADEAEWFDGVPEQVTYALSNDANGNGQNDALEGLNTNACHLMRNGQRLASNIDALNFEYFGVDEGQPACEANCLLLNPATAEDLANIRSVQVTIVARSGENIPGLSIPYTDTKTYYNRPGDIILPVQNDGFRRIHLSSEITCRNIGLL